MKGDKKIAVIGAGMMGAEIALAYASSGTTVLLKDIDLKTVNNGCRRVESILNKWIDKGKITSDRKSETIERIIPREDYSNFDEVGLVIEAVVEDKIVKTAIFQELAAVCNDQCIISTNTSSIPVTELAHSTPRPDRFVGLHFFSPASIMKLVEVIAGIQTSDDTVKEAMEIVRQAGKEPIRVKDCAGFLVNRLLFALFNEAWRAVDEGVASPEDVDKALRLGLGYPIGIFQMQDLVGLDNALSVSGTLYEEYGERFKPHPLLKKKVAAGHYGRKTGKGWFDYNK